MTNEKKTNFKSKCICFFMPFYIYKPFANPYSKCLSLSVTSIRALATRACASVLTSLMLIRCLINGVYFLSCCSSSWCKAFSIMHKSAVPLLRRRTRDRDIHHEKSSHPIIWSLQGLHATPTPANKSGLEVSNGATDFLSVAPPGKNSLFTCSHCVMSRKNFSLYNKYCMCVFT